MGDFIDIQPLFASPADFQRFLEKQTSHQGQVGNDEVLALRFFNHLFPDARFAYERPLSTRKQPDFLIADPSFGEVLVEVESFTKDTAFLCALRLGEVSEVPPIHDPKVASGELPPATREDFKDGKRAFLWSDDFGRRARKANTQVQGRHRYPTLVLVGMGSTLHHDGIVAVETVTRGLWRDTTFGREYLDELEGNEPTGLFNLTNADGSFQFSHWSAMAVVAPPSIGSDYLYWHRLNSNAEAPLPDAFIRRLTDVMSDEEPSAYVFIEHLYDPTASGGDT